MKKSKAETAVTRTRIIEAAAQAFMRNGIEATGVAEIMATVGLTAGGFYRHFDSKEQLVAEAYAARMDIRVASAEVGQDEGYQKVLEHLENVLSVANLGDIFTGCPIVAMGSELARASDETRHVASGGIQDLVEVLAKWNPGEKPPFAEEDAICTLSSMVGAATLSRIVDDPELSTHILDVVKKRLADSLRAKIGACA
jgi:TetR/AcrR family transcriptional repressor of nem operon